MKNVARRCVLKAPLLLIYTKYLSLIIGESPRQNKSTNSYVLASPPFNYLVPGSGDTGRVWRRHGTHRDCGNRKSLELQHPPPPPPTPPAPPETLCLVLRSRSGAADSFPAAREKNLWKAKAPWESEGSQLYYTLQAPYHRPSSQGKRGATPILSAYRLGPKKKNRFWSAVKYPRIKFLMVAVAYAMQSQRVYLFSGLVIQVTGFPLWPRLSWGTSSYWAPSVGLHACICIQPGSAGRRRRTSGRPGGGAGWRRLAKAGYESLLSLRVLFCRQ